MKLAVGVNNISGWQCQICNGTWSDEDSVRRHVAAVHPETLQPADEIELTPSDPSNQPTQQSEQTAKVQSQSEKSSSNVSEKKVSDQNQVAPAASEIEKENLETPAKSLARNAARKGVVDDPSEITQNVRNKIVTTMVPPDPPVLTESEVSHNSVKLAWTHTGSRYMLQMFKTNNKK